MTTVRGRQWGTWRRLSEARLHHGQPRHAAREHGAHRHHPARQQHAYNTQTVSAGRRVARRDRGLRGPTSGPAVVTDPQSPVTRPGSTRHSSVATL